MTAVQVKRDPDCLPTAFNLIMHWHVWGEMWWKDNGEKMKRQRREKKERISFALVSVSSVSPPPPPPPPCLFPPTLNIRIHYFVVRIKTKIGYRYLKTTYIKNPKQRIFSTGNTKERNSAPSQQTLTRIQNPFSFLQPKQRLWDKETILSPSLLTMLTFLKGTSGGCVCLFEGEASLKGRELES